MSKFKDLTGKRYKKLVVLHRVQNHGRWVAFLCQCDCGNTKEVTGNRLQNRLVKSCGCLKYEGIPIHGRWGDPEYKVWDSMMRRCYNPKRKAYIDYGGRGIFVVERWHTAANFLNDMGTRPSSSHTLERRDNNGPYSKENCYWATRTQQQRNTRRAILLTYNGVTRSLADWCDDYHQNISTVRWRLNVLHWDAHDALTITPNKNANRRHRYTSSV